MSDNPIDWGSEEHLTIAVTFDGNVGTPRTDSDDEVYIFAYVPELGQGLLSSPAVRSAGEISLTVPAGWNGMTAHLWGFAVGKGSNNTDVRMFGCSDVRMSDNLIV